MIVTAAISASASRPLIVFARCDGEGARQPLPAEGIKPGGELRIVNGELPFHLVEHALLFHRQGHSATSGQVFGRSRAATVSRPLPTIVYQAFAVGKRKPGYGRNELRG